MANLQLIAKGGLIVLIVISIAVLIERLTNKFSVDNLEDGENQLFISTTSLPTVDIVETIFDEKIAKCLAEHSKSYYYEINETSTSTSCQPLGKCMHSFLIELCQLMASFTVNLKLLEPDLLFCLLPTSRKFNLLTRGFTSNRVLGSRNVITFGIFESEAKVLEERSTRMKLISSGYRIWRFQRLMNAGERFDDDAEFYHFFIIKGDLLMHLIVLYSRESYLWSPGLNPSEIELKGLHYVNDRMFENFTVSSVHLDTLSMAEIFLPSDTRCFLLDMITSNFLECKAVSSSMKVNDDVLAALKHLKALLASHMVSFWLWSKSLQGWFEKCDVLHYTGKLKFSVAAKSVEGFNFSALFNKSECQHIETSLNFNSNIKNVKIKCNQVPIDLNFIYEEKITYWYEYVDEHNTYKLNFPKFSLCSTDIYGQKISVPCETEEILEGEYGQFLKNVTLNLDPEMMKSVQLVDTS